MKAKDIENSFNEKKDSEKLKEQIEVLRAALDLIYTEANKFAGEYPEFNARIANKALLATKSYCVNQSAAKGYIDGFRDGYEQCSADEESGDWTENGEQLEEYASIKASDYLNKINEEN